MNYPSVSKVYRLGDGKSISVDQTNSDEDKTCLCFAKLENGVMKVEEIKLIEKQKDIDKYISKNIDEIYKVFGVDKKLIL